ncbi:MAG: hypothetical protein IH600_04315 [Bacteroidetes bacterium]|nr:hypothetical protein [Bacteroidota bacterium]
MRKAAILIIILTTFFLGSDLMAQARSSSSGMMVQASMNLTNFADDFKHLGSLHTWDTRYRIREYCISIDYIIRTGTHTAIDLEFGYRYLNAQVSTGEASNLQTQAVSDAASMLIPHFMVSFNPLDSVLVPYIKAGVGIINSDSYNSDLPLMYSLGAGGIYLAGDRMWFRGELNFRGHHSISGSNTKTEVTWSAFLLLLGVGFRF